MHNKYDLSNFRFEMRSKRFLLKSLVLILCISVVIIYYTSTDKLSKQEFEPSFVYECQSNSSAYHKNLHHVCFGEPRIFFVETSGASVLNSRQACAIESTAHHNPSYQMIVLMMSSKDIDLHHQLTENLQKLPNVEFYRLDIKTLTYGTPIFDWYLAGKWKNSEWKASHLSDSLRYLLIWKYGGMYLDLDIVTLKSMENIRNSAITENWDRVAAGLLFFDKGHELMKRCMYDFAQNYDPYNFVKNGPGIITKQIKELCDIDKIDKVSGVECGVDILPPEAAFPIPYDEWEKYFIPSLVQNVTERFNSSYLIHVWNKYSKSKKLVIGQSSLYEKAIKQNCPIVYKYAERVGYI